MKKVSVAPDGELVERTRAGDRAAYAELWRRHSAAALTVARASSSFDADDLVAEAFAKVFAAIRAGGGPSGAFRSYLFTTVRNVAASWGRKAQAVPIDDLDDLEDPTTSEDEMLAALDRSTTARAFRALPSRWQEVLWYTEVEAMSPRQVAALVGMKPNAVAALAVRAREGLRQAWITVHLASTSTSPECRATIERLAAHTRGSLGARATAKVSEHLDGCPQCTIVAEEATRIGSRLALVLLPLVAGVAGAGAYLASVQHGAATAVTAAALGSAGATASGAQASAVSGSGGAAAGAAAPGGGMAAGALIGLVAGGVAVVAGVGVAVALVTGPVRGGDDADAVAVAEAPFPTTALPDTTTPNESPAPSSPTTHDPETSADPVDTLPRTDPAPDAPTEGTSQAAADPSPASAPQPSSPSAPSPAVDPGGPTIPAAPAPLPAPLIAVQPGPASVYPLLSGTALAGAEVRVALTGVALTGVGVAESRQWTTTADSVTGEWALTLEGIRVGDSAVTATQTVTAPSTTIATTSSPSAPVHVTLDAPPVIVVEMLEEGQFYRVSIRGPSNATVRLYHDDFPTFQSTVITLNSDGNGTAIWSAPSGGFFVRFVDGSRVGAAGRPE